MCGLSVKKKGVMNGAMAFIVMVLVFCCFCLPAVSAYAEGYESWVRDKESGPPDAGEEPEEAVTALPSRGKTDLNDVPDPSEDEIGKVQQMFSENLMDVFVSMSYMLKKGKADMSATGIIMSHVTSSDGTSFFVFDLTDTNIYGIVGATIYVALRTLALGFLFIFILGKLIVTLYESDVRGMADMKAVMLSGLITMILMFIMPQIVDWVCVARNSIAKFLYAKLTTAELGTVVTHKYGDAAPGLNVYDMLHPKAGTLVNLSGMEKEYYQLWADHKSILNAIVYFMAAVLVPLVYAFSYIKIAIQQTVMFGMYPAFALLGVRDKNINGKWAAHFFCNVFVPTIDLALLFIPGVIVAAIDEGDLVGVLLKALITSACFLSVVPVRNRILSMLGNSFGIAPNMAGAIALGAAVGKGLGNIFGGAGEALGALGSSPSGGGAPSKDEADKTMSDLAQNLQDIGGAGDGVKGGPGGGGPDGGPGGGDFGSSKTLDEIGGLGSGDKGNNNDNYTMNDSMSASSDASSILNGGNSSADADIMKNESALNQEAEELANMNQSAMNSDSDAYSSLNQGGAESYNGGVGVDNDSQVNNAASMSEEDFANSGINSEAYSELNQEGADSMVGATGIDNDSIVNEALDQNQEAVGVGGNTDIDSSAALSAAAASAIYNEGAEGSLSSNNSSSASDTTVNEAPKGEKMPDISEKSSARAMDPIINDTMKNLNNAIANDEGAKQRRDVVSRAGAAMDMKAKNLKDPHRYQNMATGRLQNLEQMTGLQNQSQQVSKAMRSEQAYSNQQKQQMQNIDNRIAKLGNPNGKEGQQLKAQRVIAEQNYAASQSRMENYTDQQRAIQTAYGTAQANEAAYATASGNLGMSNKTYTDSASYVKDVQIQDRQRRAASYANFSTAAEKGYLTPEERVQFERQERIRAVGSGLGRMGGAVAGAAATAAVAAVAIVGGDEQAMNGALQNGGKFINKGANIGAGAGGDAGAGIVRTVQDSYGMAMDAPSVPGNMARDAKKYAGKARTAIVNGVEKLSDMAEKYPDVRTE